MNNRTVFITTASWEPRFIEGATAMWAREQYSAAVCFWFEEFADRTKQARDDFQRLVGSVAYVDKPLRLFASPPEEGKRPVPSHIDAWKTIHRTMAEVLGNADSFVLDITTMPRETLWITLDLLSVANVPGAIVYHRARSHGDWCACEPERPHIVPKLGGVPSLEASTKLLIVSGYDEDRSEQFISAYEPEKTLILFQESAEPESTDGPSREHRLRLGSRSQTIDLGRVDCYEKDWGYGSLMAAASDFAQDANLILASLGPKTSAVALYRMHCHFPQSSLVYAPCKEYNTDYSSGLLETLSLEWRPGEMLPKEF